MKQTQIKRGRGMKMNNVTTIQIEKTTHEKLKLGKIQLQAKLGRSLTMDEYLQILIERSEHK